MAFIYKIRKKFIKIWFIYVLIWLLVFAFYQLAFIPNLEKLNLEQINQGKPEKEKIYFNTEFNLQIENAATLSDLLETVVQIVANCNSIQEASKEKTSEDEENNKLRAYQVSLKSKKAIQLLLIRCSN